MQEKATARFHSGWSNFAEWMNDTTHDRHFLTYRQSKRLFIKYMGRRLLVAHHKSETFTCPPNTTTDLLCEYIRDAIGKDGGTIASSMSHGCLDCTHTKRYREDLVDEGLIFDNNPAAIDEGQADEINVLNDFIVRLLHLISITDIKKFHSHRTKLKYRMRTVLIFL